MSPAPDYAEPIVGWRSWAAVEERDGGLGLRSVVFDTHWAPRERVEAVCGHGPRSRWLARLLRVEPHPPPDERCECGVYAARTPEQALPYLGRVGIIPGVRAAIVGRVALWGRVIEYERGWRGAFAYPRHLYLLRARVSGGERPASRDLARRLSAYGVPVDVVEAPTMSALLEDLTAVDGALSGVV